MPPHEATVPSEPESKTLNFASKQTGVLFESDNADADVPIDTKFRKADSRKIQLVWPNIIYFTVVHFAALYGLYLLVTQTKWQTNLFTLFLYAINTLGITAGAHRLWAHRSYKAKWPLRVLLMIFNTIGFQDSIYHWVRDHRVHHKFSDTDADPYNAERGFFYSHIGWLLCRKHPETNAKGKMLDMSDLRADPIVMFQRKYYKYLMPISCFILPTIIPAYFWNESTSNAFFVAAILRWCFCLNVTWCVNSAAHMFGMRPYDRDINPVQNPAVSIFTFGEGWHNYHHVFPWDYKTAELGDYSMNFTTAFIDFFAKLGLAYDLKSVMPETVERRVLRTGDGSHKFWGWGDKDLGVEQKQYVRILKKVS